MRAGLLVFIVYDSGGEDEADGFVYVYGGDGEEEEGKEVIDTNPSIEAVPTNPWTRTTSRIVALCGFEDFILVPVIVNR